MKKIITENYFKGSIDEWRSQIPEHVIDEILQIPSFKNVKQKSKKETKDYLWSDVVTVSHVWGQRSETEAEISPSDLKKYADSLNGTLSRTVNALKNLEYEAILQKSSISKEFIVANHIRRVSRSFTGRVYRSVSPLLIKQEYKNNGKWGKYCPLDNELPKAISQLEGISSYIDKVINELDGNIKGRGTQKKSKDGHDQLIWQLCRVYKEYTGKKPKASTTGGNEFSPNKVSGDIIPYLQAILPHTHYKGRITPTALQKKIFRMSKHEKYNSLWTDNKR